VAVAAQRAGRDSARRRTRERGPPAHDGPCVGAGDAVRWTQVKRVVRSQRDKRYEFISTSMKAMHNYAKINDWANVLSGA